VRGLARHGVLAWLAILALMLGSVAGLMTPQPARAQDQTIANDDDSSQWDQIGDAVDQGISNAWNDNSSDGSDGSDQQAIQPVADTAPTDDSAPADDAAPTDDAAPAPSYDANGNMIDPNTGVPLAIGADGTPIDAADGLYFDDQGNLIDPATGLAVSYDENGQPILPSAAADASTDDTSDSSDANAAPAGDDSSSELVTTPWLAPPPSGPPPGFANWSAPRTVYIPDTGHSIDGVFLDAWRQWGGVASWGNPITSEMQENGITVQYYDYGRFEYHPDDPNGVIVQFGDLGKQMQPFVLRRTSGTGSAAANEAAMAARAWAPMDPATVRPDTDVWRFVPDTAHGVAGEFKAFWEATGEAGYLGNPLTEPYKVDGVTYQVFERGKLSQQSGQAPALVPVGKMMVERLRLDTTPSAQGDLPNYSEDLFTPPAPISVSGAPVDPNGERWVKISISLQYLWAYQGDQVLWQGYVSTGRAGFETPTGTFNVVSKLPSQTMEGVIGGEYYNVPDVPDVMYFTNLGHALHGTYWHHNFGTPMSHGCVNLPMDVAAWMYQWSSVGMRVEIDP
jgi:hypothetical protein